MADTLFPVFDVPSVLIDNTKALSQNDKIAPLWDFETGDFVMDQTGKIIYGSSYDSWVTWCRKTILTQRGAYLAYSNNIGIEGEEAFKEPDLDAVENSLERTITEALLADPLGRTVQVSSFQFDRSSDSLSVSCTVSGTDGATADIQTSITL